MFTAYSARLAAAALTTLSLLGCGEEFDAPSDIKTLRVMGVQKTNPYPAPGEEIELNLLWHDGSSQAPRDVQRLWIGGCVNPPGDLFYNCYEDLTSTLTTSLAELDGNLEELPGPASIPEGSLIGVGNTFRYTMPEDALRPAVPGSVPNGVAYVWYVLCAGTIGPSREGANFPLACFDERGHELDVPDFVVGYTALYTFGEVTNANPRVTGLRFAGEPVTPDCIDAECVGVEPPAADDLDCDTVPCVPACSGDCPEYSLEPIVDIDSVEPDPVASASGKNQSEQFWVKYYVNGGSLEHEEGRLVYDPNSGLQEYDTKFKAPREPGAYQFWAVVHDNRGGAAWVRQSILVTP